MNDSSRPPLESLLLGLVPQDGSTIGNKKLREAFFEKAAKAGRSPGEQDFEACRQRLLDKRVLAKGRGRGGSVYRGEQYKVDARTTDRLAERLAFPEEAARNLAFRLEVVRESEAPGSAAD